MKARDQVDGALGSDPAVAIDDVQRVRGRKGMSPRKGKKRKLTKSEQMARVRSKDTEPEMLLRRALWGSGLRYRLRPDLPGTPDFAFIGRKIAVFVDGCFWHGCPEHYTSPVRNAEFWKRKVERNQRRDRKVDQELADLGWTAIRIWEHEVTEELDAVVESMRQLVVGEVRVWLS